MFHLCLQLDASSETAAAPSELKLNSHDATASPIVAAGVIAALLVYVYISQVCLRSLLSQTTDEFSYSAQLNFFAHDSTPLSGLRGQLWGFKLLQAMVRRQVTITLRPRTTLVLTMSAGGALKWRDRLAATIIMTL